MTAVMADEERGHLGASVRIGTMVLVRGALGRLWAARRAMMILYLASAGAELALTTGAEALGPSATTPSLHGAYLARIVIAAATAGLTAAVGWRVLLQGVRDWRRIDRNLLECAGIVGLSVVLMTVATVGPARWAAAQGTTVGSNMAYASMASGLLSLVAFYLLAKLALWPIGRLMGRPEVGPARSWRLMRRATRGFLLAHALAILPFVVATTGWTMATVTGAAGAAGVDGTLWISRALAFVMQGFSILSLAISATAYSLRVENPATVADVFD